MPRPGAERKEGIDVAIELCFIDLQHPDYAGERALRFRVLREPFGEPPGSEWFDFEPDSLHLVAVDAGRVVGCVLFHPESAKTGRLYQMAVEPERQGSRVGSALVRGLEAELVRRGVGEVTLHARDTALPFYEKLGYASFGAPWTEIGIVHHHMRRGLR